jgi:type VII secretion protein EssB
MPTKKTTYFESLLDLEITQEKNQTTFVFQTERIGLKSKAEIEFLKEADDAIRKEIQMTDDELIINVYIPSAYKRFNALRSEDEKTRWIFAHQLVEKVKTLEYPRLNLVVCPENLVFNTGMTPFFLYYGVMESLPPFGKDEERVWLETKAAVAAAVNSSHTFEEYVNYHETLELKAVDATIMSMTNPQALLDYINEQLEQLKKRENTYVHLPKKKWKASKFLSIGLGIVLVPALIFTIYFFVYEKPRNEAYLNSHEYYLGQKYSDVVTILSPHSVKEMPFVVLYELAYSYVINEALAEEQKENVLTNITLQTDTNYLKYWIYIGRNEAEEAINLARLMEDGELITYGLLKRREEIQAENELSGEEKQQLLEEIDAEVDEYKELMEQEEQQIQEQEQEELEQEKEQEQPQLQSQQPGQQEQPQQPQGQ